MKLKKMIHSGIVSVLSMSLFFTASQEVGATSFQVSPGVTYESDQSKGANVLKVDLTEEFSELDIGVPDPLNRLKTTSQQARENTREGHRVVGAINASFFNNMGAGANNLPFSIITKDNEILSFGRVSDGREHYRSEPIVFGQTSNGKVAIGEYDARVSAQVNGKTVSVDNMNSERRADEAVLFTPSYIESSTRTNSVGIEIVVEQATGNPGSFSFGDEMSGVVTEVKGYSDPGDSSIPKNGFVLSAHGEKYKQLQEVQEGDSITVEASIDDHWMDASFILGSGPQLVRDGEVNITMDPSSWRYSLRTERTAVGVDKAGDQVFMVTMGQANIKEVAEYMSEIGVDRALNFDGGGSTTLVAREHGNEYASVMNRLSGGRERAVSSTLQAISTAPTSELARLILSRESGAILNGEELPISYLYGMDKYYNPVSVDDSQISWRINNEVGSMDGSTFIAEQVGEGRIQAHYNGNQVGSTSVNVTDTFDVWNVSQEKVEIGPRETVSLSIAPELSNGEHLIYDPSRVEWQASGDIGMIDPHGKFTASDEESSGIITVRLAGKVKEIPVEVQPPAMFSDVSHDYWAVDEIEYLAERQIVDGYEDGTYRPGNELKRSQAASMLSRAFDLNRDNRPDPGFIDVDEDFHAYSVIAAVADEGYMLGDGDAFRPNGDLTRAQMAVILARAFELETEPKGAFKDVDEDYWAYEEIEALAAYEIGRGSDGNFNPGEPVTRAQFATFMKRALEN